MAFPVSYFQIRSPVEAESPYTLPESFAAIMSPFHLAAVPRNGHVRLDAQRCARPMETDGRSDSPDSAGERTERDRHRRRTPVRQPSDTYGCCQACCV